MKSSRYMDRAMKSRDPRFARVLGKLGYSSSGPPPDPLEPLRAEAQLLGVQVDGRWGEAKLRAEIETAKKPKRVEPKAEPRPAVKAGVKQPKPAEKAAEKSGAYDRRDLRAKD